MPVSDAELARQAQQGNRDALGALYDRHQEKIFRYVTSRSFDRQLAQDITEEIFLRMVTHIGSYRPMGVPFTAWLYRIAHNTVIDHNRERLPAQQLSHELAQELPAHQGHNPAVMVERKLEEQLLISALDQIDPLQREVIVLRFLMGYTLKETASSVEKSVAAVKAIQHRGLHALNAWLGQ